MSQSKNTKTCPFCRAVNPPKAYACTSCFKVMNSAYHVPWWKLQIERRLGFFLLVTLVLATGLVAIRGWTEAIEAKLTISLSTNEYEVSMAAGKRQREIINKKRLEASPSSSQN